MSTDTCLQIKIPNLLDYPFAIQQVELNNTLYFFEYFWNIRHNKAYLSIYYKKDNEAQYIVKNICLVAGICLTKSVHDDNWSGKLYFGRNEKLDEVDYRIDTLHEGFFINYFSEDDNS